MTIQLFVTPIRPLCSGRISRSMVLRAALTLVVFSMAIVPVFAAERPVLRGDVVAKADVLTLADLVEGVAGPAASVPVSRASGTVILAMDVSGSMTATDVVPSRLAAAKKAALSLTLNDVRLYDALRVLADMAELKMVYAGNIYYVTTAANARSFQPPPQRPAAPPAQPAPRPTGGM